MWMERGNRMAVFEQSDEHEQVVFFSDHENGLRAIVAIHSTALGPALGGTRFYPYANEDLALQDVLRLSKAMTFKAACAGLDLGGGKAVIIGDPTRQKSEALLRSYARFVESLGGRYFTACDVGTSPADMDVIARETRYVVGRTVENGGAGDSSILTAYGVYQGMRAAAQHTWGSPSLAGRVVGVSGAGKVGRRLVDLLVDEGSSVLLADVSADAVDAVRRQYKAVRPVEVGTLEAMPMDIYAPCALGGVLTDAVVVEMHAKIICGAANNQLAHAGVAKLLQDRGILYAPDFLVNAGGLIQVADERNGYNEHRARVHAGAIFDSATRIFAEAAAAGITPTQAGNQLALHRIGEIARLRSFYLPSRQR
jgi:valine dehydrogenase (NAD+)